MRKVLSLLLAVIMLISCAPFALARGIVNDRETVAVTGIELNRTSASLKVGQRLKLYANILPENATDRSVTWTSSDETVATVDGGVVIAQAEGSAVITATTNDGGYSALCMLYVQEDIISVIEVSDIWYPPVQGERCGDHKSATLAPESDFEITDTKWYCDTESRYMPDDEVFEFGKRYSLEFFLKANEGLYFDSNPDITLNDGNLVFDPYSSVDNNDCSVYYLWVKPYVIAQPIESINIDGVNLDIKAGDRAGDFMDISVSDDAHAELDHVFWYDDTTFDSLEDDDTFKCGHMYTMGFYFVAEEGYKFTSDTVVTMNGSDEYVDHDFTYVLYDGLVLDVWSVLVEAVGTAPVSGVVLNRTEASVPATETITLKATVLPDDAADKSVTWSSSDEDVATVENGVVTGVSEGEAVITVTTTDGGFTASCKVTVTKRLIHEIGISDICYPPAEGTKSGDCKTYTLSYGSHFTVASVSWYCDTDHKTMQDDDVFEFGKKYSFNLNLKADDGYDFDSKAKIMLNYNGIKADTSACVDPDDPTVFYVWTEPFLIADVIERIDIECIYPPVAGMKAGDCMNVTYAEDSHFKVGMTGWEDGTSYETLDEDDLFIEGNTYAFGLALFADDGYKFDESTVISINGGEVPIDEDYTYILYEGDEQIIWTDFAEALSPVHVTGVELDKTEASLTVGESLSLTATVTPDDATEQSVIWESSDAEVAKVADGVVTAIAEGTAEITVTTIDGGFTASCTVTVENTAENVISEIIITDIPHAPEPGVKSGDYRSCSVPEGVHYSISETAWLEIATYHFMEDDEVFKSGMYYSIAIEAVADEGYIFSDEFTIKLFDTDGNELAPVIPDLYDEGKSCVVWTDPVLCDGGSLLPIDKIEVNDVNLNIKVGDKAEDYMGYSLPENAPYTVTIVTWTDVTTGDADDMKPDEVFQAGHIYRFVIVVMPTEGYCFAENPEIFLNGGKDYSDMTLCVEMYALIASNDITPTEPTPEVLTGDLNGDGKVNTADAVIVLKYAAEMVTLDDRQLLAGDTNHDGKVNTADAVLILKYAAEMITEF